MPSEWFLLLTFEFGENNGKKSFSQCKVCDDKAFIINEDALSCQACNNDDIEEEMKIIGPGKAGRIFPVLIESNLCVALDL